MFISFLVRLKGTKVIEVFDAKGQYVGKLAMPDLENVFNWWVFVGIVLPGLVILGNM
jgi:hypothetical protein